jgi:hypothetical protein
MYLNGFSVRIVGGKEDESSGYVEVPHGTQYSIVLKNDRKHPCDAEVEVDGKSVGTFRLGAKSTFKLDRPENEAKRFTFYRADSDEGGASGASAVDGGDRGLVRVTFHPGKMDAQPQPREVHIHHYHDRPYPVPQPYPVWPRPEPPWGPRPWRWGDSSVTCGTTSGEQATAYSCDAKLSPQSLSVGDGVPAASHLSTQASVASECSAGVTGLTGHSDQQFSDIGPLDTYFEQQATEINLRLVAVAEERQDPTPLKPVMRKTPIPPPIMLL